MSTPGSSPGVSAQPRTPQGEGPSAPDSEAGRSGELRAEEARQLVERFGPGCLDEETELIGLITADYPSSWSRPTQAHAQEVAESILGRGFRRVAEDPAQPELITMPVFHGCTDTNPDFCACNEGPVCCAACGEAIGEGEEAYASRFPLYQWMPPDAPGQEWEDQFWHTNCDLRAAALRGGEQQ